MNYPTTSAIIYRFSGTIKELRALLLPEYNLLICPKPQPDHWDKDCLACVELNNLI